MSKSDKNSEQNFILNPKQEFQSLYFDKLQLLAIDKCLRLNKEYKIATDENEMMDFVDLRNKHVEACLDKVYALHRIFDEEYINDKTI
jgi:hypothetical protein